MPFDAMALENDGENSLIKRVRTRGHEHGVKRRSAV